MVVAVGPGAGSGVVAVGPGAGSGVVAVGPGAGSGVGAHGLRDSMACGVFLDQGSSPCLLYCQMDS